MSELPGKSFAVKMNVFARKLQRTANGVVEASAVEYLDNIIDDTPVDRAKKDLFGRDREPGNLKRSWNASIGDPAPGHNGDPRGQMLQVTSGLKVGTTVCLTNNARYAALIEYGVQGGGEAVGRLTPPPTWRGKWPENIDFQLPTWWVRMGAMKGIGIVNKVAKKANPK